MSAIVMKYVTELLTLLGVLLLVVGGVLWWKQNQLEAELLGQQERVLLAVTADPTNVATPATLPGFPVEGEAGSVPTTETTPSAASSPDVEGVGTTVPVTDTVTITTTVEAVPTETPAPTPTSDPFPPAASHPTHIRAPAIGLDAPVVEMGWEVKTDSNGNSYSEWIVPANAAGWHVNSALPGHGTNTVLSGHHNIDGEVFRYIVDLEPGNQIELSDGEHVYHYQVQEKYIVAEKGQPLEVRRENNKYIEPTSDERLTLVSCWPYETNTHRVIVIARPVSAEVATSGADEAGGTQ